MHFSQAFELGSYSREQQQGCGKRRGGEQKKFFSLKD
jgi:hypothetical protein